MAARRHTRQAALVWLGLAALLPTLPVGAEPKGPVPVQPLRLYSPAFDPGHAIPRKYTCDGEDTAPPLVWEGEPESTRSLVLIVDDPDAPDPSAPRMTWVHWLVFNLPSLANNLPEGGALPPGARSGLNDWKTTGYRGPCPAKGQHRYFFRLYALDDELSLERPTREALEEAMRPHVLAEATLSGTYQRTAKDERAPNARLWAPPRLSVNAHAK